MQASGPPRRKRLKIDIACQSCRSRKIKCDGIRPVCGPCQKKARWRQTCAFHGPEPTAPPKTLVPASSPLPDTSPEAAVPQSRSGRDPQLPHPDQPEGTYYGCAPAGFGVDVSDAVDAKLGLPSSQQPPLVPMTNAPLFGFYRKQPDPSNADYGVDNVLPPRKRADYLVDVYWEQIHPIEPFLDRERFTQLYRGLFAGASLDGNERIFTSSLNAIFALSTQLHEDTPSDQREDASSTYFHRALSLLRPEYVLFETPSLDLVECLLLVSRYLQCTNNPHQTWMVVGSAVRIAQSLGLHLPRSSTWSEADFRRRRQLWQFCVFMDRGISWALGRPTMVSEPMIVLPESAQAEESVSAHCFTKVLELYEIANHVMLSQVATSSSSSCGQVLAEKIGLPRLYRKEDPFSIALQCEGHLKKWEAGLPSYLKLDSPGSCDAVTLKQRVMVHLRLLHGRIFMFRPMLARVCLPGSQSAAPKPAPGSSLEDRLTQSCASVCIECAQEMVSLIQKHHNPQQKFGILPWWQRVFYLHVAATILIAAMLRADFYTPAVSDSWAEVMEAFHAHEHLSPFIGQCISSFQSLAGKIAKAHHPGADRDEGGLATSYFHDILQDDNFLVGMDDMAWLSNFESISGL